MVDQRVAAEKQNGVGTPYIPPMTRRLKCRIDPEQSPYTCMLPEHKPVRRGREQNIREGLSRGQFRVLACRVPFLQILPNQLPPQVGCEIARPLLSSTAAGLPSNQVPDSSLLRRLLSFARWRPRGKSLPRSCLYLDPLCPFNTHSTGTSAGAPLFLINNTRNFAGLVLLAFRSTT